jgi:hypothetical protein
VDIFQPARLQCHANSKTNAGSKANTVKNSSLTNTAERKDRENYALSAIKSKKYPAQRMLAE